MTTRYCEPLLKLCGPNIYSRNAFRLLGADVDQKERRIKRAEKEFQSAIEVGELAEEYCVAFLPDPLPMPEEIAQAARELADSQQRFIHEFFWFWPLEWGKSASDEPLNLLKAGDEAQARERWEEIAIGGGNSRLAAKHNLAVLAHRLALDREQALLAAIENGTSASPNIYKLTDGDRKELDACWSEAFKYWDPLCMDEAFRSVLAQRIRLLDDPRLTTGFLHRFLESIPIAFDNINAEFAVACCDRYLYDRAADHVEIMKATNAGDDDVDFSIRRVTGPLQERIDHAVKTATEQLSRNKVEGKQRSGELFSTAQDILHVLRTLLGENSLEYIETCDRVAESMLQCQVAYGNSTEDWESSIPLLEDALNVSRGDNVRDRIEQNLKIVRSNRESDLCWFCGQCNQDDKAVVEVAMFGDVTRTRTRDGIQVEWSHGKYRVPRCLECNSAHSRQRFWFRLCGTAGTLLGLGGCFASASAGAAESGLIVLAAGSGLGLAIGAAIGSGKRGKGVKPYSEMSKFPLIKELVAKGWEFGNKPDTNQ